MTHKDDTTIRIENQSFICEKIEKDEKGLKNTTSVSKIY